MFALEKCPENILLVTFNFKMVYVSQKPRFTVLNITNGMVQSPSIYQHRDIRMEIVKWHINLWNLSMSPQKHPLPIIQLLWKFQVPSNRHFGRQVKVLWKEYYSWLKPSFSCPSSVTRSLISQTALLASHEDGSLPGYTEMGETRGRLYSFFYFYFFFCFKLLLHRAFGL